MSPVLSPRQVGGNQFFPHGNTNYRAPSHVNHGQPRLCQEPGFRMSCEQSIYKIRFALEDRLSVELVFGEKFVSVTGLNGLFNTGSYKS